MAHTIPARSEIETRFTWNVESVFPSDEAWEAEFERVSDEIPTLTRFRGHLGDEPATLLDWFQTTEDLTLRLGKVFLYANMVHNVDTANPDGTAKVDRARGLFARAAATTAFAEPEILGIGIDTLRRWMQQEPKLSTYAHYFDRLEKRRAHVRSPEVEEVLGLVQDPFGTATAVHATLTDTDLRFEPARNGQGEEFEIGQGTINALLTDPDREVRRTAWENYADAHLRFKETMAGVVTAGVKQHVFTARARLYGSSLESALEPNHIPTEVFHNLIETFRKNLHIWHRYWKVRRAALGYDKLYVYDVKAPLTDTADPVPFEQAMSWIVEGMKPLGSEYVDVMRNGVLGDRWVDVYPNKGKRSGAYSAGWPGTFPFVLMSYNDDLFSLSTLAHELGHSMHSYFSWSTQPLVYSRYGIFLAEVASNFNQALVRAHLLETNPDPDFQIAVIEEAMSNFHRYFFVMPTLARFELEIHERTEKAQALTAETLIDLAAELFGEVYGDEIEPDHDRVGITWAQFPIHMYLNFYVFQYATGISAANALAQQVLEGDSGAAGRYIDLLKSGGSQYPLDTLRLAGVDMTSPEPVQRAFDVMGNLVERLAQLTEGKVPQRA